MYKSVYCGSIFIATKILLYSASPTSFSLIMESPEGRYMEGSRDVGDAGRCLKQTREAMVPRRNDLLINQSKKDGASHKKELS